MAEHENLPRHIRFADFAFDRQTAELRRQGVVIALPPQPTKVLARLLERPGELISRDELRQYLWPNTVVEFDHGLNTCVRQIRDALGEAASAPRYVQTVPRRGYRFVATVTTIEEHSSVPVAPLGEPPIATHRHRRPRALLVAVLATVALGAAALALVRSGLGGGARRVAVLPFQNLSPDVLSSEFVEGLSEELTVALARYQPADVSVIARTSAKRVADTAHTNREIAHALRATHLVQGTVRARGDTVIVTTTLVRASDGAALWSARFASDDPDPMAQMAPLGGRIASAMVGNLAATARLVRARSSASPDARAALLKGRYLLARSEPAKAEAQLREAVRLDPEYGLGFALLARARLARGDRAGAAEAAARARVFAPELPETHEAMGDLAAQAEWDWDLARREYRQAITLAPGDAELHQGYAFVLAVLGRADESLSEIRLALDLDPVSPLVNGDAAWLYFYARHYAEAARQARATLALKDNDAGAWYCLLMTLERAGRVAEAQPIAAQVAQRYGAGPQVIHEIRRAAPTDALDQFWRWDLEQMQRHGLGHRYPLDFAAAYARFRQPDSAFSYIDRSILERFPFAGVIAVDPRFDQLRADPRFATALGGLGLRPADGKHVTGGNSS